MKIKEVYFRKNGNTDTKEIDPINKKTDRFYTKELNMKIKSIRITGNEITIYFEEKE